MSKYAKIIERVFSEKTEEYDVDEPIPFRRADLERAIDELGISVGNVPDIPYAYRSRRQLPESISDHGYTAVVIDDSREGEDPTYLFTRRQQLVSIPENVDREKKTSKSVLPDPVRRYIGDDEQGALTQVRYAGLLDEFTGLDTYHLQSHLRMRVSGREAELDDLYIGVAEDDSHHALAVEAKGVDETLNKNQLARNTRGIEDKSEYPDSVRTLGVKLDDDGRFFLFEFHVSGHDTTDSEVDVKRVWKYSFEDI
jgi:hypothetical protein